MSKKISPAPPILELGSPNVRRVISAPEPDAPIPKKKSQLSLDLENEYAELEHLKKIAYLLVLKRSALDKLPRSDKKHSLLNEIREQEKSNADAIYKIRKVILIKEFSLTEQPSKNRTLVRETAIELGLQLLRSNPNLKAYIHCALELIRLESHLFSIGRKAKRRAGFAMLAALSALPSPPADLRNELVRVRYLGRREKVTLFAKNNGVAKLLNDFESGRRQLNLRP